MYLNPPLLLREDCFFEVLLIAVSCFGIFQFWIENGSVLRERRHVRLQKVLAEVRLAKGLTQVALAARLDKPQSYVSKYESGERRLDLIEFFDICSAIGEAPELIVKKLYLQIKAKQI